jgi:hypothetical protein
VSRPIEKGGFVHNESHPEYGTGRVLAVEPFSTRVLFSQGGLRVFRAADMTRLKGVAPPPASDIELLDAKEADLAKGVQDHMANIVEKKAPKKRASKKAVAAKK